MYQDLLRELKSSLGCEEAFQYAEHVILSAIRNDILNRITNLLLTFC